MSGFPGGAVTFLFSDIEGSTRLVKALRDGYAGVLEEHRRLVRAVVAAHGGHVVDMQGDAFFVAFGAAKQAVLCALGVQRALAAHRWPAGAAVRVRIGVHTGPAVPDAGGGYTGLAVHRAARICAAAAGGQVLISQATRALVEDEEEELGFTLVDVGERALKDLDRPVRLFQLAAPGLDAPVPAAGLPGRGEAGGAAGGVHGFPAELTSFIGRAGPVREVAGLLEEHRLVTVTGPGGSGKTRLAGQVARRVAARVADGARLAELAPVGDPALVPAVVAVVLGVREQPGVSVAEVLARVLARQQLLLVLDNCEHVIGAAAQLCAGLLAACDDVRVLATSREPLRVAGEARYRLGSLILPGSDDPVDAGGPEAVALFADRARRADPHFGLSGESGPVVARLVTRLDGMPLAIELAAARVEALGVGQLLDRLDDRFTWLTVGDRLAAGRHRSLAATVEWSYQLLGEHERRVFRGVSVFPGPFTLEAAEAVAGPGAGPAVLRLVDCSLLVPPQEGPDGRSRYGMLETLSAYGAGLLAEAGEAGRAAAALAGHALGVAERAAAGLQTTTGEAAAARRLDAEDAAMRQALAWAMDHDAAMALRLAVALAPWWHLRGRLIGQYPLLREIAARAEPGGDTWCTAQFWLGLTAYWSLDRAGALDHFTAVRDAIGDRGPSRALADCLAGRSLVLTSLGRAGEAADDARRAVALAREISDPAAEVLALVYSAVVVLEAGDVGGGAQLARQAQRVTGDIPGWIARGSGSIMTAALIDVGDLAAAERMGEAGLALARDAGDLGILPGLLIRMATVDLRAGRIEAATSRLREALQLAAQSSGQTAALRCLDCCGYLCAAAGRAAEAVTVWAALDALVRHEGFFGTAEARDLLDERLAQVRHTLGPARTQAAEERGAAMSLATATEYALMLTDPSPPPPAAPSGAVTLSARERELVTLVAQGRTDAQIAAELYISIRTVRSHLDRIGDKTGCRRRVDLTWLALSAGLV
jgi:predicted ATPase/class 3 adenylate cyclase/DNA-binding CsgD family transcriptional regulator